MENEALDKLIPACCTLLGKVMFEMPTHHCYFHASDAEGQVNVMFAFTLNLLGDELHVIVPRGILQIV